METSQIMDCWLVASSFCRCSSEVILQLCCWLEGHVKPRPGHKSSAARQSRTKSPQWLPDSPRYKSSRSRTLPPQLPGPESPRSWSIFYFMRRGQRVAIERKTQAFSFFSFLFSYAQNCFLFPFFHLRGKGVIVLITWLQFTWDKTKGAKTGGERRNERGRGGKNQTERCTHG